MYFLVVSFFELIPILPTTTLKIKYWRKRPWTQSKCSKIKYTHLKYIYDKLLIAHHMYPSNLMWRDLASNSRICQSCSPVLVLLNYQYLWLPDKNWIMRPKMFVVIIQFNAAQPSEQRPKLFLSFSGSCPPKISLSTAINQEHVSWLAAMENDSLE